LFDGLAVEEPLDLECGVGHGDDARLEVNLLPLLHLHRLWGRGEHGSLASHLLLQLSPSQHKIELSNSNTNRDEFKP
jgi:hypothetical protein